jgi:hypothetical protein
VSATTIDHDHLRDALADGLQRLSGRTWTRADDGSVRSDGSLVVFVAADLHGDEDPHPGHVDIGIALNPEHPEAPVLWDCVVGIGRTPAEAAEYAAFVWLETTAPTVLEFVEQRGRLAAHLDSGDPDGLPGMHVLHGPVLAFGSGDSTPLRDWAVDNIVLPALRETLLPRITGSLHGVKLLFGGRAGDEVAEVRVDHAYDEASSRALADLPWPRLERPAFARAYLLVMPSID